MPFTEEEVGAAAPFESAFMAKHLAKKKLSKEAKAVLDAGRALWKEFFKIADVFNIRQELRLNRPDAGWYQVRNALKQREERRDQIEAGFATFDKSYAALSKKLEPQVYDLGFLRP